MTLRLYYSWPKTKNKQTNKKKTTYSYKIYITKNTTTYSCVCQEFSGRCLQQTSSIASCIFLQFPHTHQCGAACRGSGVLFPAHLVVGIAALNLEWPQGFLSPSCLLWCVSTPGGWITFINVAGIHADQWRPFPLSRLFVKCINTCIINKRKCSLGKNI